MATLVTVHAVKLTVYANDHLPAHFHIRTSEDEALIAIKDLTLIAGKLSAKTRKVIWPWIEANMPVIRGEWNRLHPDFPV